MKVTVLVTPPSQMVLEAMAEVIELKIKQLPDSFSSLGMMNKTTFIRKVLVAETKDEKIWFSFFYEHFDAMISILVDRGLVVKQKNKFYVAPQAHGEYVADKDGNWRFIPRDGSSEWPNAADPLCNESPIRRAWRWFSKIWKSDD